MPSTAELTEEEWSRLLDNINHENPAYERTRSWDQAYWALVMRRDQRPLAELLSGNSPIPPVIRQHLGRMLHPSTDRDKADRLIVSRSPRLGRAMRTNQDRMAVGVAFLSELAAGTARSEAIRKVGRKYKRKESYILHAAKDARTLPSAFWDFARENPPVWSDPARKRR
jgi:hypothetical protein